MKLSIYKSAIISEKKLRKTKIQKSTKINFSQKVRLVQENGFHQLKGN